MGRDREEEKEGYLPSVKGPGVVGGFESPLLSL